VHDYFTGAAEADIYATLEESFPTLPEARSVALMRLSAGGLVRIVTHPHNASAQRSP
jgi:hypothetical protein